MAGNIVIKHYPSIVAVVHQMILNAPSGPCSNVTRTGRTRKPSLALLSCSHYKTSSFSDRCRERTGNHHQPLASGIESR